MISLVIIFIPFITSLISKNEFSGNNENINAIFENNEIENSRNSNKGISCHTYIFDKLKFYKSDAKSVFIDYLSNTKSQITDRPTMTFISIILHSIPNGKIIKTESQKIMQFISSFESFNEYPSNKIDLYKILITKMDIDAQKKDLFSKLPDLHKKKRTSHERLSQNVFNIFILEDIEKNNTFKMALRKEIEKFFYVSCKRSRNNVIMKILVIESIKFPESNMFIDMDSRFKNSPKLAASILNIYFLSYGLVEDSNSYCQTCTRLRYKGDLNKIPNILESQLNSQNISSLLFYEKYLYYNLKFTAEHMVFEIAKRYDNNNTYAKLLNFLGYSPLEKFFEINFMIINDLQYYYNFKIKVLLNKKIIKEANNEIPALYKNIKQIIVSVLNIDSTSTILIDYGYETDSYSSEEFPLLTSEREMIQEKEYNENIEAKKLINFIDFYESFMFGRHYFYFKHVYLKSIDFNNEFCFYKREVWFKYLNIEQIHKILHNSSDFKFAVFPRSYNDSLKNVKNIEVFSFEREYTKNISSSILNNNFEVLEGFKRHHFFESELCFYSNIRLIKYYKADKKYLNVNNFIKIDFGYNKNYFIFFREVPINEIQNDELYDLDNIKDEAKIFLMPAIKELLGIYEKIKVENYSLNFIEAIFNITKTRLHDILTLERILCHSLRQNLEFFLPRIRDLMVYFLDHAEYKRTGISNQEVELIKILINTSVTIIKRNYKNINFEACVLSSLSNIFNKSQELLESML